MRRLLYSHKGDIDGMGEVILSMIAFGNIDYVLCKNVWDLEQKFQEAYENQIFDNYDVIYITDLSLTKPTFEKVMSDEKIKDKLFIFDHHETAYENGLNNYPNCIIRIENELGKSCATQIYYEYLLNNNYIQRSDILDQYVEMTRREDIYEWKKLNDFKSHDLAILFNQMGPAQYIDSMYKKLIDGIHSNASGFEYNNFELELINQKKQDINEKVKDIVRKIKVQEISLSEDEVIKVGVCFITYEYRNEVADFIRFRKDIPEDNIDSKIFDIDVVAMVAMEINQISLRGIQDNNYARRVAEKFGGAGHDTAAGIPMSDELYNRLINQIFLI